MIYHLPTFTELPYLPFHNLTFVEHVQANFFKTQ